MGVLDAVVNEAEGRLGIDSTKATTLLSGLLNLTHEQAGASPVFWTASGGPG